MLSKTPTHETPDRHDRIPVGVASPEASTRKLSIIVGIALALVFWGLYLGRGVYLKHGNTLQGCLVFGCVLGFLTFWGVLLANQKRPAARAHYSKASITGFVLGLVAVLLALPVDLTLGDWQLNLAQPGILALISLALLGLCVLLSIIGLSRPQQYVGKNLGLFALPLVIVWICLRVAAG